MSLLKKNDGKTGTVEVSTTTSITVNPLCSGEFVAQFKFTVLLMANGPLRITNSLFEPELYKSEHEVEDPELKVIHGFNTQSSS